MPRFFRAVYAKLGAREPIVFMVASVLRCRRNVIARSDIVELVMRITSGKAPVKRSWLPPILMELLAVPPPYTHIEVPGSGRGVLYIMRSPQFEPELFKPLEFHAVGSGEGVIEEISTVHDMIVAGEIGNSFMEAMWFHQAINEFIETKGIKSVGGLIPMLIEYCINNGRIAEGREHAMWYETTRCPRAAGEATTTGGAARKGRPDPVRRRSPGPRLGEFRVPVVAGVSAARAKGITAQADAGATACVVGGPEAAAREAVVKGPASGRLHDRPVDAGAGGHPDSPRVRRSVSPESCVEGPDRPGVELSEARTPGRGAGRGGHCPLEA
jgi:hypothetical protein